MKKIERRENRGFAQLGGGGEDRQFRRRLSLARILALGLLAAVVGVPNVYAAAPTAQTYTSQSDGEWISTGNNNLFGTAYTGNRWDSPNNEDDNRPIMSDINTDDWGHTDDGFDGFYGTMPGGAYGYAGGPSMTNYTVLDNATINHRITLTAPPILADLAALGIPSSNIAGATINDLTINAGGSLLIDGTSLSDDPFTVEAKGNVTNAGTLKNITSNVVLKAGRDFTNTGIFDNSGTAVVGSEGNGDLTTSGTFDNTGDLSVYGALKVTGGTFKVGGTLYVRDGFSFELTATGNNTVEDGTITGESGKEVTVNNSITLNLKDGGIIDGFDDIALGNGSTITVSGQNNAIGSGTSTTGVEVGSGDTASITGTNALTDSIRIYGDITGSGTVEFSNVTADLNFANASGQQSITTTSGYTDVILAGDGKDSLDFVFGSGNGLNPGHSPGTFQANNVTFQSGSILYIEIGSGSDNFDKLVASGNVTFLGTTTIVLINYNNQVTGQKTADGVIEASSIIVGTETLNDGDTSSGGQIGSVTNNTVEITTTDGTLTVRGSNALAINDVSVSDSGKKLNLDVTGDPQTAPGGSTDSAAKKGQANLVTIRDNYLNNIQLLTTADATVIKNAVAAYAGADTDKLNEAMLQLDPVMASLGAVQTFDAVQKFVNASKYRAYNRVDSLRRAGTYLGQECDPCAPADCNPCDAVCGSRGTRDLWFQTVGGWTDQNTENVQGYTADMWGFALGVDRKISSSALVGVSVGGEFSRAKSDSKLNTAKSDAVLVSLYGAKRFSNLFITASGGYAGSRLETKRSALGTLWADGKRDADTWFGNFEAAYRFGDTSGYLTPFIAYDFVDYTEDGFTERGNMAMTFAKRDVTAYFQTLGAKFGGTFVNRHGRLVKPEISLGWLHDYGAGNLYQTATFVAGGPAMALYGTSRNPNRFVLGVNIEAELSKRTTGFFRYDGEFANRYNGQYLTGGVNVKF